MGIEEVNRIKNFFEQSHLHPIYREHAAVVTSEEAAKTRGDQLKEGIKALLFTNGEDQWVIVDVPADKKVDQKKVAEVLGWSKGKIRMATAGEVMQKTGCEIGAVPPFGHKECERKSHSCAEIKSPLYFMHKEQIQIVVDTGVYENEKSAFNIGLRTHSVKIPTAEMKIVFQEINAIEGNFTKD
ncbi:MAG TPA: YbaK/EbsC family protein [Candidatus Nanoarchaeia archaeon]|nr:YbaK/EbsC family protein [Candidatus Nanoarchaeia archaeon]